MNIKNFVLLLLIIGMSISCSQNKTEKVNEKLYNEFKNPGKEARPRVWWHWMNGNITKEGIQKDLLWMKRSGIGGFQNFDAGMMMPQVVEKRLTYMTPEWKDAFNYTAHLADSLDLEMAIAGSPGWSQTGGPWVPAKDGMKKLVWREMRIQGGKKFEGTLPEPYTMSGTFQNIPIADDATTFTVTKESSQDYYEDIAVLAYKLPKNDFTLNELGVKITSSGGKFILSQLTDGDLATTNILPVAKNGQYAWIQFEFTQPQTIKSITLVGGGTRDQWGAVPPANTRNLQVSENGIDFQDVCDLPLGGVEQQTICFEETTAKYFRINFKNPPASQYATFSALLGEQTSEIKGTGIAEIVLHPVTRINHAEEKTGFAAAFDLEKNPTPETTDAVEQKTIINLTDKLNENGELQWDVPEGNWKIVRYGYSLTGKKNHPASPEATGLEVDTMPVQ